LAVFDRKDDYGYIKWADHVRRRDHFTCVVCGRKGVVVNAHHLNAWASFPNERYDVSNGVCLCQTCHESFHSIYGKGKNTVAQFKEFESIMGELIKLEKKQAVSDFTVKRMLQNAEKDKVVQEIINHLDGYYGHE
jgi:hypothetical protein